MDGYGNNLTDRARDLAEYILFLDPQSAWRVHYRCTENGQDAFIKEAVPTESLTELSSYLKGTFERQQKTRFPLMQFAISEHGRLRYSPSGHAQVDLKIPVDRLGTAGAIVKSWWRRAEETWPLARTYAFNMAQEALQRSLERRRLHDELKLQTAIAARLRMERGLPQAAGHTPTARNVATIGWLDRIPVTDVLDANQFAGGVIWRPDAGSGYGLLQLGAEPADFTLEMSDSVHRALGSPSLDELRAEVAALKAQNNST